MNYLENEVTKNRLESAWLLVSENGNTLIKDAIGEVSADAIIDAGSLVEVVGILPAILKLVERRRKKLALNHPVSQYLQGFNDKGKDSIQIMNLLTHTSGLPEIGDFNMKDVAKTDLLFQPGTQVTYSSLNMQLLPSIYELVSDFSFEEFLDDFIFKPLLMANTEVIQDVKGMYHLQTTLSDLSHFGIMVEQEGTYDYLKIINKKAMQLSKHNFTSFLNENRGLGWSLKGSLSITESMFSEESYGFMGTDGVSMWFEPELKSHIILKLQGWGNITNLNRIQSDIHHLIFESLS